MMFPFDDIELPNTDFDENQVTKEMPVDVLPPLEFTFQKLVEKGTWCYFCGIPYAAVTRTTEGHPVCGNCPCVNKTR